MHIHRFKGDGFRHVLLYQGETTPSRGFSAAALYQNTFNHFQVLSGPLRDLVQRHRGSVDTLAVLDAHGGDDRTWFYEDRYDQLRDVQRWVNMVDDPKSLLVIAVCNPGGRAVTSNYSLVLYPDANYSIGEMMQRACGAKLHVPRLGTFKPTESGRSTVPLPARA